MGKRVSHPMQADQSPRSNTVAVALPSEALTRHSQRESEGSRKPWPVKTIALLGGLAAVLEGWTIGSITNYEYPSADLSSIYKQEKPAGTETNAKLGKLATQLESLRDDAGTFTVGNRQFTIGTAVYGRDPERPHLTSVVEENSTTDTTQAVSGKYTTDGELISLTYVGLKPDNKQVTFTYDTASNRLEASNPTTINNQFAYAEHVLDRATAASE